MRFQLINNLISKKKERKEKEKEKAFRLLVSSAQV
jgi:hypothetical protein